MKDLLSSAVCSKCGNVLSVNKEGIRKDKFYYDKTKKYYQVTYCECKCGNLVVLQVDDDQSIKMLNNLIIMSESVIKKRENGELIGVQSSKKAIKLNNMLDEYRKGLRRKISGKKMVNVIKDIEIKC